MRRGVERHSQTNTTPIYIYEKKHPYPGKPVARRLAGPVRARTAPRPKLRAANARRTGLGQSGEHGRGLAALHQQARARPRIAGVAIPTRRGAGRHLPHHQPPVDERHRQRRNGPGGRRHHPMGQRPGQRQPALDGAAAGRRHVHLCQRGRRAVSELWRQGSARRTGRAADGRRRRLQPLLATRPQRRAGEGRAAQDAQRRGLGEPRRLRHQQGRGAGHLPPLCRRDGDARRPRLPQALAAHPLQPVPAAERRLAVLLEQAARRPSPRLLPHGLRRERLGLPARPLQLGDARLRHAHLHQHHLPLPQQPALHTGTARLHRHPRAQRCRLLPPRVHPARGMGRQGNLPALRRGIQRDVRLGQRKTGRLQRGGEQRRPL